MSRLYMDERRLRRARGGGFCRSAAPSGSPGPTGADPASHSRVARVQDLARTRSGGMIMGVRLTVRSGGTELSAVETMTEDDFMYFRDSICMALEGNDFGSRFPVFQGKFFSDWDADEVAVLERELSRMHADMRRLPPKPADSNWASKLAVSGRQPGRWPRSSSTRQA